MIEKIKDEKMIDQEKVKKAVRLLLEGIGEDADREGLIETPDRIARMCEEIYGGYEEDAKSIFVRRFMWKTAIWS